MSGPPKDIPASELWLKLQELPRPTRLVDFPRKGPDGEPVGQLAIRVLTQQEQMAATLEAERLARKHLKEGKKDEWGYDRLFTDAICVEVIFRACRDAADPNKPAFPSPEKIRQDLTTDECAALFTHYTTAQIELGPDIVHLSDEEVEAWIERLVEGGSAFPFHLLGSDLQHRLLLTMAFRLRMSQTDSNSAGEQPYELLSDSEKQASSQSNNDLDS